MLLKTIVLRDVTTEQILEMRGHRVLIFEKSLTFHHTQTVLTLKNIYISNCSFRFRGELGKQVCVSQEALITVLR